MKSILSYKVRHVPAHVIHSSAPAIRLIIYLNNSKIFLLIKKSVVYLLKKIILLFITVAHSWV
jgi:hypothetical protein